MIILVTGSRQKLTPRQRLQVEVHLFLAGLDKAEGGRHILVEGAATGVDSYAHDLAKRLGWGTRRFPADWTTFGKKAGPIRNQQMLDKMKEEGTPVELVLAFPAATSKGTWDMVERAVANRVPVRVYPI